MRNQWSYYQFCTVMQYTVIYSHIIILINKIVYSCLLRAVRADRCTAAIALSVSGG